MYYNNAKYLIYRLFTKYPMAKKSKNSKKSSPTKTPSPTPKPVKSTSKLPPKFSFKENFPAILLLTLLCFILYGKSISYDYVLDDTLVITDNNYTKKGFSGIYDILSSDSFKGYFGEQKNLVQGARYRPLSIVSFAIEHAFFGLNPKVSHFINIVLYAICCLLIFRCLFFLFPKKKTTPWYLTLPFLASLLYTLHPLHVEAVANIKGRDEIMAMIGAILSLIYAFKYINTKKIFFLFPMLLSFFLGVLSKETCLSFLGIIPLTLYLKTKKINKSLLIVFAALALCTLGYLIMRYNIIGYLINSNARNTDIMNNPFAEMNGSQKSATIMYTLGLYIKLHFFPHPLTHDYYPYHIPIMEWVKPGTLISLIIYLALIVMAVYGVIKKNMYSWGISFFLLSIVLVSNVVVNVGTFMNERFMFMASLGLMVFLIQMTNHWLPKKINMQPHFGLILPLLFALGFFAKSWQRVPAWKDTLALNASAIKVSKNSARLNSFMATAIFEELRSEPPSQKKLTQLKQAREYLETALAIHKTYYNANLMKSGVASEIYKFDSDLPSLLKAFKEVAIVRPDVDYLSQFCAYLNRQPANRNQMLEFYYDLGYSTLYKQVRNAKWAIHYLELGYQLDPNSTRIKSALSEIYLASGNNAKAQQYR